MTSSQLGISIRIRIRQPLFMPATSMRNHLSKLTPKNMSFIILTIRPAHNKCQNRLCLNMKFVKLRSILPIKMMSQSGKLLGMGPIPTSWPSHKYAKVDLRTYEKSLSGLTYDSAYEGVHAERIPGTGYLSRWKCISNVVIRPLFPFPFLHGGPSLFPQ